MVLKKRIEELRGGDWIDVREWRDGSTPRCQVLSEVDEDGELYVHIRFPNGDVHYAVWIEEDECWESGDT